MIESDHILLWDHACIKVLDIRHALIRMGDAVRGYKLPASVFLLVKRGGAQVLLDGTEYDVKPLQVMHSGKGTRVDIFVSDKLFEYYMIYYKASVPHPGRHDKLQLLERNSPFHLRYLFSPNDPITLFHTVALMEQEWRQHGPIGRFRVKSLFYQFVCSILRQLHGQGVELKEPDLAAQAIAYIEEHYAEPITLESLAEVLNYSVPHLSAIFKKRTGSSPIDYLIGMRMDKATILLAETDAALRDIAAGVGYSDPYYFGRLFKKHKGTSPARYRMKTRSRQKAEDNPGNIIRSSIVAINNRRYIEHDNHYHNQYCGEGDLPMYKTFNSTAAASLLLCLALLLSACAGGATNQSASAGGGGAGAATATASPSVSQQNSAPAQGSSETKTVATVNGEIEIPVNPKRIVADQYLGSFIALGVTPVGAPGLHWKNPYIADSLASVEDIGDVNGSLEKVIDLKPDLIVTGAAPDEGRYEQLSKIAPTLSIPYGDLKNAYDELTFFGKLLGKEKEAEAWLAEYDRRIGAARESIKNAIPADATFSILEWAGKSIYVYGDNFGRGGQAVYQALGFKPPAAIAAEIMEKQWAELSNELLPQYAGDYIVLTSNTRTLEDVKADPIWGSLDAVKNDRVYVWKEERSWYYDPTAILAQTEELAAWLTGQKSK